MKGSKLFRMFIVILLPVFISNSLQAWTSRVHQVLGGLTKITNLPYNDQRVFRGCMRNMWSGTASPDIVRDSIFPLFRLGYAESHQSDAVFRSVRALKYASRRYRTAINTGDYKSTCQAVFQLGEAIHYLQDCACGLKVLRGARKGIAASVADNVISELLGAYGYNTLREIRAEESRYRRRCNLNADMLANMIRNFRHESKSEINRVFQAYARAPVRDPVWVGNYRIDRGLYGMVRNRIIRAFGMMLAAQSRYLELFVRGTGGEQPVRRRKVYVVVWFRAAGGSYVYYRDYGTTTNSTLNQTVDQAFLRGQIAFAWPNALSRRNIRVMRSRIEIVGHRLLFGANNAAELQCRMERNGYAPWVNSECRR